MEVPDPLLLIEETLADYMKGVSDLFLSLKLRDDLVWAFGKFK